MGEGACGGKNMGGARRGRVWVRTASVPTTSNTVRTSFLWNCILAPLQKGAFGASAQELSDHRVFGPLEFLRFGVLNNFALVQHRHARADAKSAGHFVSHRD